MNKDTGGQPIRSYIAYYSADNQFEEFETFEEAKKWLEEMWGHDDEISEETVMGKDFIAEVTHRSQFKVTQDKEKDGYKWNEEAQGYFIDGDPDEEEWTSEYDKIGEVKLVPCPKIEADEKSLKDG